MMSALVATPSPITRRLLVNMSSTAAIMTCRQSVAGNNLRINSGGTPKGERHVEAKTQRSGDEEGEGNKIQSGTPPNVRDWLRISRGFSAEIMSASNRYDILPILLICSGNSAFITCDKLAVEVLVFGHDS